MKVSRSRLGLASLTRLSLAALAIAALTGTFVSTQGCESGEAPKIDCATVTVKKFGEMTIWTKCTNCHSTTRTGDARHNATPGYDYNTPAAAKATALEAQDDVAGVGLNDMPPTDEVDDTGKAPPLPTEEEKQELYAWVQCGQPS